MEDRIHTLIQELVTHDPTLLGREEELRVLIRELSARRPDVTIDPAFKTSLRARLMLKNHTAGAARAHAHSLSWWATRLIPVGTLVVMLVLVAPEDTRRAPHATQDLPPTSRTAPESVPSDTYALDFSSESAAQPGIMSSPSQQGKGGDPHIDAPYSSIQSMRAPEHIEGASSIIAFPQGPGPIITVSSFTAEHPSFLVAHIIHPDGTLHYAGVSPLLANGTYTEIPVHLTTRSIEGATYALTVVHDTGNGVFSTDDTLVLDEYGNPIRTSIYIGAAHTD